MYNLMIVDDESEIRTGLANYFPWQEIGFQVIHTAENGREALDYILKNHVDALLCDIKMPVMSGIELAQELNSRNMKIKMVFLSGYKEFEYARTALKYGVRDYIIKPTKYNEIIEVFSVIKNEIDLELESKYEHQLISMRNMSENNDDAEYSDIKTQKNIIRFIKNYVSENYKNVTLEGLAKVVYMNPDYLSKFFKQKTGLNFSDFLNEVCMKKAGELLKNADYKTYEVSTKVGYSNPHNFARAFKKYYGMSPSEYRHAQCVDSFPEQKQEV